MQNDFYYRFEQRFRGSREEIKRRQSVYLPILEPLKSIQSPTRTLDLGCGRGEWLELMAENGFSAQGADLDDAMLQFCMEQDFVVRKADALDYLRSIPDATLSVVTGFHIAEHLPFESLQNMVLEAHRTLIPGGVLILETPNPENLVVGACNFYTDPTHRAPLPPHLLAYLGEDAGFKRVKILRLNQPPQEWYSNPPESPSMSRLLFGVGPDYAIVAQKDATAERLMAFSWFAETEDGLNSLGGRINEFDAQMLSLQQETQRVQSEQMVRLDGVAEHQRSTDEQIGRLTTLWGNAQRVQSEQMARLDGVLNSRSWRITTPLREANATFRKVKSYIKRRLKTLIKRSAAFVQKGPWLKPIILAPLAPFPKVKARLRRAAGLPDPSAILIDQGLPGANDLTPLSSRAEKIYTILKHKIEKGGFQ
ncbi:putative Methyltransferase type 11 [Acidithiobacillus ferrivorans]|uniref:Methyltransferase type 11 n=1 Tax=Acidithiobacillus ferrivorans TaxID=160808 RepID=A0A060UMP0_9PROT|nr:class I SAM-dependent methyltransferase [Acidithiobacillus ferrivorans]CDQ09745.1 putative Methyltransferase type 11 [Acidithiobacillus ferrivorans]SMH66441.1 putative Methyltransferase type 11 [Acidithiobacillus ferrivorans]